MIAPATSRPFIGVVRQRHGHQQRAKIGVAQAQRPEFVRILRDLRGRIAGEVHQDFLRRNGHIHRALERWNIELPAAVTNFIKFNDARLQAVSSRNIYSSRDCWR